VLRCLVPFALAAFLFLSSSAGANELCPRVRFTGPAPKLSEVEKRLVCGDPGSDGWEKISLPQARTFMIAFLQKRGRHFPRFDSDGDTLVVDAGPVTIARSLVGRGLRGVYDLGKRRKVTGRPLTPDLLDEVKKAVLFELSSRGYPCSKATVTADARTGEVRVDAAPGDRLRVGQVEPPEHLSVDPAVLQRYSAFDAGDIFDTRMLSLTSDRIKNDALFASAYFDATCSTAGLRVVQRVVEAPPHLLTIGVGADTEGLLRVRARLRQSRIGKRASFAEASVNASRREQSFDAMTRLYLSPEQRLHLVPALFVRHEDEVQYEAAHSEASLSPAWGTDAGGVRLEVRGGPAVDYFDTARGQGPRGSSWFQFITRVQVMSHLYEYYQRDPRDGWTAAFETAHRARGAYSEVTAHWLRLSGQTLWNIGNFQPPLAVLATRGSAGTVAGIDRAAALSGLPPTDRFFLGGDADLRGVDRKRLPDDGSGFLTKIYGGVELRAGDVLPYRLQPFLFIDAAMGGSSSFHFDPDVYYSPGAGLRWASPIGTVRATAARGLTWRRGSALEAPRPHWQFFLSLGSEF
jgi:translocation and assembly module TamA